MFWSRLLRLTATFVTYLQVVLAVSPVVDLGYAKYEGTNLPIGVDQFLGMRYARPPTGELRFRAPLHPTNEIETQSATEFGKVCIGYGTPSSSIGEDCLFVNVFKPTTANETSKLPVWVYFQGGGYRANSNKNYNGTGVIVESDFNVVFVNFNYRVGPLGFLSSNKVQADGSLNTGLLDQRRLLWWVQENIASFGGDPEHVVIHGTSAGGGSVAHQMTAYGGRDEGLFVGVGLQSPFWPSQRTISESEFQFDKLAQNLNCTGGDQAMACLRSVAVEDLLAAAEIGPYPGATSSPLPQFYWLPVLDGDFVQDNLFNLFEKGKFVKVPTLSSHCSDEGSRFAYDASNISEVLNFMRNNYPNLSDSELDKIAIAYPLMSPVVNHNAYFPSASAAYGDRTFICASNTVAAAVARRYSKKSVWSYRFNVQDPENVKTGFGVPHAYDMTAILGVGYSSSASSYANVNAAIVPVTMNYWISFVRNLNPNTYRVAGSPYWKPWGPGKGALLKLETNSTELETVPASLAKACRLWRTMPGAI